jgi:DNA-binding MarR family transcriptional regulator
MSGIYYIVKSLHNEGSVRTGPQSLPEVALERLWGLVLVLGDRMQAGLAERGLTAARAELLWALQTKGTATQGLLSKELRTTPRNVTGLVDALETDGFVARTPHPTDRRATLVKLTKKGLSATQAMRRDQDQFARVLFRDMKESDLATFTKVLDLVVNRVSNALPDGDGR